MKLPVTYLLTFSESEVEHAIDSEWCELIRCRTCKWFEESVEHDNCQNLYGLGDPGAYDYCSYAERREE